MSFPSGNRYEGAFEVGKFHGYGVFYAASGMKYEVRRWPSRAHLCSLCTPTPPYMYTHPSTHAHTPLCTCTHTPLHMHTCTLPPTQGQFQDGHAHGQGLVTFADGSHGQPKQEGRFEGDRCGKCCVHVATSTEACCGPCVQVCAERPGYRGHPQGQAAGLTGQSPPAAALLAPGAVGPGNPPSSSPPSHTTLYPRHCHGFATGWP